MSANLAATSNIISVSITNHQIHVVLVENLSTRWHHLYYFFDYSCINWKFDAQAGGTNCISCKFGHQVAPLVLVENLATRWCQFH